MFEAKIVEHIRKITIIIAVICQKTIKDRIFFMV